MANSRQLALIEDLENFIKENLYKDRDERADLDQIQQKIEQTLDRAENLGEFPALSMSKNTRFANKKVRVEAINSEAMMI